MRDQYVTLRLTHNIQCTTVLKCIDDRGLHVRTCKEYWTMWAYLQPLIQVTTYRYMVLSITQVVANTF